MNLENKNSKFEKTKNKDFENEIIKPQSQRNKLKLKIINKYNITPMNLKKFY